MKSSEPLTPVTAYTRRRSRAVRSLVLLVLFALVWTGFWLLGASAPQRFEDDVEHFKYGSIGSDNAERGLPYWIFTVLPEVFPEHLPPGGKGYEAFGLLVEPGRDRPVGFSKRRVFGIDLLGLNCALCHTSVVRDDPGTEPRLVVGMPANTVDLQGLFQFIFRCAGDGRFTEANLLAAIEGHVDLNFIERILYRIAIARFRETVLAQRDKLEYWNDIPAFGPGRVDTFGPYATLLFGMGVDGLIGTSDFPSLWNQNPRVGMELHWDGNNDSVEERNRSASIGAGNTPESMDEESLARLAEWIGDLPPPPLPAERVDRSKVDLGRTLFGKHCANCHAFDGERVGKVEPLANVGTDPHRTDAFTVELAKQMNTLGEGYPWKFTRFKTTDGYANQPLDGIWARAPYLHNGSVPTLWDLLLDPDERPKTFYRGDASYDWENVGFRSDRPKDEERRLFLFDTTLPGNGNGGHLYGVDLEPESKRALVEYMKTL